MTKTQRATADYYQVCCTSLDALEKHHVLPRKERTHTLAMSEPETNIFSSQVWAQLEDRIFS